MSYRLGLTGSIGMGKSTTAAIFKTLGIPVWDADDAVHKLYSVGGAAVPAIAALCSSAVTGGKVDRDELRSLIAEDPHLLSKIQTIVHPMVAQDRAKFIAQTNDNIIVLDIPLLFEIGADALCDGIIVVTAAPDVQKARVLARGVSAKDFSTLLARQMPDSEKRARATWVIETTSVAHVKGEVQRILAEIQKGLPDA